MNVVFYISGHGYGHAVRDIEIIKELLKRNPAARIEIRSRAPRWLFEPLLSERVTLFERELDFGVVQNTSFAVDKSATLKTYADFIHRKRHLVDEESEYLLQLSPDFIVSDIVPYAFDAAEKAGVPAFAVGNFSWDWIYEPYIEDDPSFDFVIQDIKESYSKAVRLFRLPFYGDMSAFPLIEDVPVIGRKARLTKIEARQQLGIPEKAKDKYILLGLRMSDLDVDWRRVESIPGVRFVAVNRNVNLKNAVSLKEDDMAFEEVLNACDAVISKPGYSMVSEVITNQTPMIYVPRQDFAEDSFLREGLEKYAVSAELPQTDFFAGNWEPAVKDLFSKPLKWPHLQTDGANVIAERLEMFKR